MKPLCSMISQCLFITICLLSTTKLSAQSFSKLLSSCENEFRSQNFEKGLSYAEKAEKLNNLTTAQKDTVQMMKLSMAKSLITKHKKTDYKQQRKYVEIALQSSEKLSESQPDEKGWLNYVTLFKEMKAALDLIALPEKFKNYDPKKEEEDRIKKYKLGDEVYVYLKDKGTISVMIIQLMPPLAKVQISGTSETRIVRLTDLQ